MPIPNSLAAGPLVPHLFLNITDCALVITSVYSLRILGPDIWIQFRTAMWYDGITITQGTEEVILVQMEPLIC